MSCEGNLALSVSWEGSWLTEYFLVLVLLQSTSFFDFAGHPRRTRTRHVNVRRPSARRGAFCRLFAASCLILTAVFRSVAQAVLYHLVTKVQCNTLFITHYPLVATSLAKQLSDVSNWHMGFCKSSSFLLHLILQR